MDLGLSGKRALVTGGSRGVGKAVARELAREGVTVAICARDAKAAEAAAAELSAETGGRVVAFRADTGKEADVKRLVAEAAEALGGLDILVNNAARVGGTGGPDTLAELNEPMLLDDFNVKVLGYLRCAREAARHMEPGGWGRSAVLGPQGSTVTAVLPGTTRTERLGERVQATADRRGVTLAEAEAAMAQQNAIRRIVGAEEIAAVVAFLCSEQGGCITGEALSASGGSTKAVSY